MSQLDNDSRTTLSVLDRLLDREPGKAVEEPASGAESLRRLKESVRRDLEWLLNTRQRTPEISADFKELRRSLAAFGIRDLSTMSIRNSADRDLICRALQDAIGIFEPRLRSVTVTAETGREFEHTLHFRIQAYLDIDPAPEQVNFDTSLQLFSSEFKVRGE